MVSIWTFYFLSKMLKPINYSTMENLGMLQELSTSWSQLYNALLSSYTLEEWEIQSINDLILSEKVFDV